MKNSLTISAGLITVVTSIALCCIGAAPALAEEPSLEAQLQPNDIGGFNQNFIGESACHGVSFPLETEGERYLVTEPGDNDQPGTLRWAINQANAQDDISEVVISAGLVIEVTNAIAISAGTAIRSSGPGVEVRTTGDGELFTSQRTGQDYAIEISDLTLTGGGGEYSAGLDFERAVCALAVHNTTVQDFTEYGVIVGDTWPFVLLEVENSTFQNNGNPDDSYGYGALTVSNEGISGAIHIRNSVFVNNHTVGVSIDTGLESTPEARAEMVVERSKFLNNAGGENDSGAIEIISVYVDNDSSYEGDLPMPSTPIVSVTNSLFSGNSGSVSGAISVNDVSVRDSETSVSIFSVENSTFLQNSVNENNQYDVMSTDLRFDEVQFEDAPDVRLMTVSNSTFTDPVHPSVQNIRFEQLAGQSVLNQVTLVGGGVSVGQKEPGAELLLMNSVLDTGTVEALVEQETRQILRTDGNSGPYVEQNMAYTLAPTLIPAGIGRLIGTSADFELLPLDATLGPTPVRVPGATSVLLDKAGLGGPATDQRGLARPQGVSADIGSVERYVPILAPSTVTVGSDQSVASGGALVFQVFRENAITDPWTGIASVRVSTLEGSAKPGTDYTNLEIDVVWELGDISPKNVSVETFAGVSDDPTKTLSLVLTGAGEHTQIGVRSAATGTITYEEAIIQPPGDGGEHDAPKNQLVNTGQNDGIRAMLPAAIFMFGAGTVLVLRGMRNRRLQAPRD